MDGGRGLERSIQHQFRAHALGQLLAGRRSVADAQHPLTAQIHARHPQSFRDVLHHQLGGEQRLGRAETTERAIGGCVGGHGARANADVGGGVRTRGVDCRPGEDDRRQRAVGTPVELDLDVLRDEAPVRPDRGAVRDHAGMALGAGGEILVPVVDQPHRTARLAGQQRGMNRHDRGVLFLAAEPTPRFRLHYDRLFIGQLQGPFQGTVDVVGALQ